MDQGIDLRTSGFLNPVRDQNPGNCCFGFVGCASLEYFYNKHANANGRQKVKLSPQDLYDNLVHNDVEDKEGISLMTTFEWMKNHGCIPDESCPYRGAFGPPAQDRPVIVKVKKIKLIPSGMMKSYLKEHGPIAVPLINSWIKEMSKFTGAGIYNGPDDPSAFHAPGVCSHGLLVVGYDSEMVDGELVEYWIVQNSYGNTWGDHGYAKFNMDIKDGSGKPLIFCGIAPEGITVL